MRVTSTTTYLTMQQGIQNALEKVAQQQEQLSTGRRINRYSDAPSDAVTALRYSSQASQWQAWQSSAADASQWLNTADSTLQTVSTSLARVRTLATNAVNSALGQSSLDALADEIDSVKNSIVDLANTKMGNRALFAGFQNTAVQQVSGAWTYSGDTGAVQRQIGPSTTIAVNLTGDQVFGFAAGAGQDLFSTLDKLSQDIRSGNMAAIAGDQNQLAARTQDVQRSQAILGSLQNRVESQQTLAQNTVDDLKKSKSDLDEVDLPQTVLKLSQAQTAYQAALSAAANANMPSLAHFLS